MQTSSKEQDDLSRDPHSKLTRLAVIANLLVWVVFVIYTIAAGARWLSLQSQFSYLANSTFQSPDFVAELISNPLHGISVVADVLSVFVQGVIYALVLKGLSLGLYMIVETDLNFRAQKEEQEAQ